MDVLWRVCGIALLCAAAVLILKPIKGEMGGLLRIGGGIAVLLLVVPVLGEVVGEMTVLFAGSEIDRFATVMLRAIGIALLTRICTDVCRDVGEGAIASGVELAGKVAILTLCLPMIREIIGYAARILQETEM